MEKLANNLLNKCLLLLSLKTEPGMMGKIAWLEHLRKRVAVHRVEKEEILRRGGGMMQSRARLKTPNLRIISGSASYFKLTNAITSFVKTDVRKR